MFLGDIKLGLGAEDSASPSQDRPRPIRRRPAFPRVRETPSCLVTSRPGQGLPLPLGADRNLGLTNHCPQRSVYGWSCKLVPEGLGGLEP